MELQGHVGHLEYRFFSFGDSVCVGARLVHGLRETYHRLKNRFGRTRRYHLVTRLYWKLSFVLWDMVLILTQDRHMVCVERTIGSEIILEAPDGTPR